VIAAGIFVPSLIMADACGNNQTYPGCTDTNVNCAQQAAATAAANHTPYVPVNAVEFSNYNTRQKISDDPTTILWCTTSFGNPSSPLITVPIAGKLTSGSKRPFASDPGPDGMYGASDPYRYGFTPGGVYVEFSGSMPTYCTTEPSVYQRQSTTITLGTDSKLLSAQNQARSALAGCNNQSTALQLQACRDAAEKILENAINGK